MLVRIATPGIVRRMRSISLRKMSPDAPRFIRLSTAALACCSGMSMYLASAPILRDDTERARMIAALRDFDIGEMLRSRQHPRRQVVIEVRLERIRFLRQALADRHDAAELVRPDHRVDFGHVLLNVATIP